MDWSALPTVGVGVQGSWAERLLDFGLHERVTNDTNAKVHRLDLSLCVHVCACVFSAGVRRQPRSQHALNTSTATATQ